MHFSPQNYWEQINTSLGELSSNMGQLRVEHQEHSIIREEDLKAMKEEQQRQGRDIEELKDIIGSSRRKRHHH